ncbi:MAG: glycosyltransferase family 4 protein [Muribaculaceae bacterium]|nr:glycosyltransferase family 4 protein [Muribaculaceae bacterium]
MKKQLLIIHKTQFGYLTDAYKWCQYLRNDYDITVVSLNQSFPIVEMKGIKIVDITGRNFYLRGIKFLLACIIQILKNRGAVIVSYFKEASILRKLFPKKKIILDIRTLSVNANEEIRNKENNHIRLISSKFTCVTAISQGVKAFVDNGNLLVHLLPLGADVREYIDCRVEKPHLLYVGTFFNRRIEDTINGLKLFLDKKPSVKLHYDIVGDGKEGELNKLKQLVEDLNLQEYVTFYGRIPNEKIAPFLAKANIGVSYVPITDYYQHQPPTKTYEYVLSGMYCLATATYSNREIVTEENGILIQDNPEAFSRGLGECIEKLKDYNPDKIKDTLIEYSWQNIVDGKLKPILESL